MGHDSAAIEVKNVSKSFVLATSPQSIKSIFTSIIRPTAKSRGATTTQRVLKNVSFTVSHGEFVGIVGRNGSGKSTMLKMLASIYQPTRGSVLIRGKLVPFIELGVGFNPELTGRENVYLNGALMGFSTKEVDAMYDDIVSFSELEPYMDQKLKNYSSGMQVRLAFSVAITVQADILLVDEVLAVGDADFKRKCFEYFKSLKKERKTVIFVSHDMAAVREYCDRAILIDKGKMVASGSAEDVAEQYTRLFVKEEVEEKSVPTDTDRWGNGDATITDVSTDKPVYKDGDKTVVITIHFTANVDLESPVAGFSIKNAADDVLFGTNTTIKKRRLTSMKAGDTRTIVWTAPNLMADGKHYVTATVERSDGVTVCDWWAEAAMIDVHKSEQTAYAITPQISVDISDK